MTFRIGVASKSLQTLDNHEPQRFDCCIECKPIELTCQLYFHQLKTKNIQKETHILVSGAFQKYIVFKFLPTPLFIIAYQQTKFQNPCFSNFEIWHSQNFIMIFQTVVILQGEIIPKTMCLLFFLNKESMQEVSR